jgi:hypothetical protein
LTERSKRDYTTSTREITTGYKREISEKVKEERDSKRNELAGMNVDLEG